MRAFVLSAAILTAVALAISTRADAGATIDPGSPTFNLEVILRAPDGGDGFGHVKFRQPNDAGLTIYLDVWLRDLARNGSYKLQRSVDPLDGSCVATPTSWLTLGRGTEPQAIATDDRGTGREQLFRKVPAAGAEFDIEFRVIDAATSAVVLESGCYQYVVR
jgi:hypothetical protein